LHYFVYYIAFFLPFIGEVNKDEYIKKVPVLYSSFAWHRYQEKN